MLMAASWYIMMNAMIFDQLIADVFEQHSGFKANVKPQPKLTERLKKFVFGMIVTLQN